MAAPTPRHWFTSKRKSLCIAVTLLPSIACSVTGWQSDTINAASPFCCCSCCQLIPLSFSVTRHGQGGFSKNSCCNATCFTAERMPFAMPSAAMLLFSDNILAAVRASICHLLFSKNAATPPLCRNAVEEQPKASPSALHPHTTFTTASVLLQLYRRFFPTCYHRCPWLLLSFSPKNRLINRSIN